MRSQYRKISLLLALLLVLFCLAPAWTGFATSAGGCCDRGACCGHLCCPMQRGAASMPMKNSMATGAHSGRAHGSQVCSCTAMPGHSWLGTNGQRIPFQLFDHSVGATQPIIARFTLLAGCTTLQGHQSPPEHPPRLLS